MLVCYSHVIATADVVIALTPMAQRSLVPAAPAVSSMGSNGMVRMGRGSMRAVRATMVRVMRRAMLVRAAVVRVAIARAAGVLRKMRVLVAASALRELASGLSFGGE